MKTVLIVEDDKKINQALSVRLKSSGYDVVSVYDAAMATSMAVKKSPDVAILDISIPAGSGFLVANRLATLPGTGGCPTIFVTASKDPSLRERAEELGAVAFFEKPFESKQILETVRQYTGE